MLSLRFVSLLTLLVPSIAVAYPPPPCARWQNELSQCDALKRPSTCTIEGVDYEKANHKIYGNSAEMVCEKYLKVVYPEVKKFEVWPIDANPNNETIEDGDWISARCVWDVTDNGDDANENDHGNADDVDSINWKD